MAFEFRLPDIGEGVVEGEIVTWLVKPGDTIESDQLMVEIMTDKATVEIPAPVAGTILECRGSAGDIIPVGDILVVIDTGGDASPAAESRDSEPSRPSPEQPPAPEPRSVESDRPAAPEAEPPRPAEPPKPESPEPAPARADVRVQATPAVRKLARERDVDLSRVAPTGPRDRITRDDVLRAAAGSVALQPDSAGGEVDTIPYRGLRRRIGQQMARSKFTAPHYTYVEEVDVSELVSLRHKFNEAHPDEKLTYLPFIMKAVVSGLKRFPIVNSTLDEEKGEIRLKRYYNLGIAAATDGGLVVPIVKRVDGLSLLEISRELGRVAEDARQGSSRLEDLQDGTFTITSLGPMGGILATPIINYPEVAIMGVHKIVSRPVVRDGEIVVREMMNLSISLDHRVVDGAVGAEFLQHVVGLIEDPGLLLIG